MRIILDDDMSKYVSLYLNREVKEIILDTESDSLKADFARFIKDLIEERAYSLAHTRYIYDCDRNCVAIFGFENFEEEVCYKYKKILKEIEKTKEELLVELDEEELEATKNRENKCKCCEEIEFWRNQKSDVVEYKLFAKLSQYGWKIGERKIKGKQISTITSRAFDINYCPMCGRKLV